LTGHAERERETDAVLVRDIEEAFGPEALELLGYVYILLSQRERTEVREKLRVYDPSPPDQVRGRL